MLGASTRECEVLTRECEVLTRECEVLTREFEIHLTKRLRYCFGNFQKYFDATFFVTGLMT